MLVSKAEYRDNGVQQTLKSDNVLITSEKVSMPAPPRDSVGAEIITQENVLLDAAERVGKIRDGRFAVHLHLSRLRAQNRQEGYLRVAVRMLEPMVGSYRGQIFQLSNSDIVFLVNQPNPGDLRDHIHKLRGLFGKDPLTNDDSGDGADLFVTIYDLSFDYEIFMAMVKKQLLDARALAKAPAVAAELKPLDAASLTIVLERMAMQDVAPFVRRQSAVGLNGNGKAEVIFQEYFISIADLQRAVAPDLQLTANRWMFQYLTSTLDQRLLEALRSMRLTGLPPQINLNLALPTLSEAAFATFEANRPGGLPLGIELQALDVLGDSRAFYTLRDAMRQKGYKLVIDGLDETTLRFMDVSRTKADLYKVEWSPELPQAGRGDALLAAIKHIEQSKILLSRCDSETAITWGLDHGFTKFQGRYVEAMLAATTMAVCDKASACTLQQCVSRHAVILGPLRGECGNNQMLDKPPSMRAPQRKAKAR